MIHRTMFAFRFATGLLLIALSLTLTACLSTTPPPLVDKNGQRYHDGDRWEVYRLDKDYRPVRVR